MAARCVVAFWLLLLCLCAAHVSSFYLFCPPCDPATCEDPPCSQSSGLRYYDDCLCCVKCYRALGQRCGGLSSYRCRPGLNCKHRLGLIFGEERTGICEEESCTRTHCGYRRYCTANDRLETTCNCARYNCAGKDNPVCGYNGLTYPSICQLQRVECRDNVFIGLRHMGNCSTHRSPSSLSTNDLAEEEEEAGSIVVVIGGVVQPQPSSACLYRGRLYNRNEVVQADPNDPCRYLLCSVHGIISEVLVPGCQGGPVEVDYHVGSPVVHGGWSAFTPWSECEGTCATGSHFRNRSCTSPAPRYEGRPCSGEGLEVERCIPASCNLSCTYSQWSDWGPCSVSCGGGVSTQTRSLLYPVPFEELCLLEQHRNCSPEICIVGECSVRVRYEHRVNENNCSTVWPIPSNFCSGTCGEEGGGSGEERSCCTVKKRKVERYPVACPWEVVWRDWDFEVVRKCRCRPCLLQDEE